MSICEGEHNGVAVLSDAKVREIKALYLTGYHSYAAIAKRFHVARSTVQQKFTRTSVFHFSCEFSYAVVVGLAWL
jgi:hypothetical protein